MMIVFERSCFHSNEVLDNTASTTNILVFKLCVAPPFSPCNNKLSKMAVIKQHLIHILRIYRRRYKDISPLLPKMRTPPRHCVWGADAGTSVCARVFFARSYEMWRWDSGGVGPEPGTRASRRDNGNDNDNEYLYHNYILLWRMFGFCVCVAVEAR